MKHPIPAPNRGNATPRHHPGANHPLAFIVSFKDLALGSVYPPNKVGNLIPGIPQVKGFACFGTNGTVADFLSPDFALNARAIELSHSWVSPHRSQLAILFDRNYDGAYFTVENLFGRPFTLEINVAYDIDGDTAKFDYGRLELPLGRSVVRIDASQLDGGTAQFIQAGLDLREPGHIAVSEVAVI